MVIGNEGSESVEKIDRADFSGGSMGMLEKVAVFHDSSPLTQGSGQIRLSKTKSCLIPV
jgi:hypothetical protein